MTALRRAGAPFTTAAECRSLSAANMADFHEVSTVKLPCPVHPLLHCVQRTVLKTPMYGCQLVCFG